MSKGGYQVIDLKGITLHSGTPETIEGVYSKIINNNKKFYLLENATVQASNNGDISELNAEVVNFLEGESGYTASLLNGGTILVTSADAVTYTESA